LPGYVHKHHSPSLLYEVLCNIPRLAAVACKPAQQVLIQCNCQKLISCPSYTSRIFTYAIFSEHVSTFVLALAFLLPFWLRLGSKLNLVLRNMIADVTCILPCCIQPSPQDLLCSCPCIACCCCCRQCCCNHSRCVDCCSLTLQVALCCSVPAHWLLLKSRLEKICPRSQGAQALWRWNSRGSEPLQHPFLLQVTSYNREGVLHGV
jgi:hypothetical protein